MSRWVDCNLRTESLEFVPPIIHPSNTAFNSTLQFSLGLPTIPAFCCECHSILGASLSKKNCAAGHVMASADDKSDLGSTSIGDSYSSMNTCLSRSSNDFQTEKIDVAMSSGHEAHNETLSDTLLSSSDEDLLDTEPNSPKLVPEKYLFVDIGFETLDDVLGVEDANQCFNTPLLIPQTPFILQNEPSSAFGLDAAIDEPTVAGVKSTAELFDFPAPKVLQTGFDVSKSVRGGLYDYLRPSPNRPNYGRSTNNFNRSGVSTGPRLNYITPARATRNTFTSLPGYDAILALTYKPSGLESNYYRTVSVSGLAPSIRLRHVLACIRGGAVKSATMTDTTAITGSKTALVQFLLEDAASSYVLYAGRHLMVFQDEKTGAITPMPLICRINTPTFPPSRYSLSGLEGYNQTRCISVQRLPKDLNIDRIADDINYRFQFRLDTLLECYVSEDDLLHLEFSSIEAASFAVTAISSWSRDMRVKFEADPCSRPLVALRKPIETLPSISIDDAQSLRNSTEERGKPVADNPDCFNNFLGWITSHRALQTPQSDEEKPASRFTLHNAQSIPSLNGSALRGSSWADEVRDELDDEYAGGTSSSATSSDSNPPNSAMIVNGIASSVTANIVYTDNLKQNMVQDNSASSTATMSPPSGPAASIYATQTSAFPKSLDSRSSMKHLRGPSIRSQRGSLAAKLMAANAGARQYHASAEEEENNQDPAVCIAQMNLEEIILSIEGDDNGNDRDENRTGSEHGGSQERDRNGRRSESGNEEPRTDEDGDQITGEDPTHSTNISIRDLSGETLLARL